jgi:hypothetical protein
MNTILFSPQIQASLSNLAAFYLIALLYRSLGFLGAAAGAYVYRAPGPPLWSRGAWTTADLAMGAYLALSPVLVILVLMHRHSSFWLRYCVTSSWAISVILAAVVAAYSGRRPAAAGMSLVLCLASLGVTRVAIPLVSGWNRHSRLAALDRLDRHLPIVPASGVTFVEMDHDEPASVTSRLYYLTDRRSAIAYAHSTWFENMAELKQHSPIRSSVVPYASFLAAHPHFLLVTRSRSAEDWLVRKLRDSGAQFVLLGDFPGPYLDHSVFDVTMPGT